MNRASFLKSLLCIAAAPKVLTEMKTVDASAYTGKYIVGCDPYRKDASDYSTFVVYDQVGNVMYAGKR
jgi:hypothetical protein